MKIKDLSPNPDNPRLISDAKLELLAKAIKEFGDLSGLVFNRRTKQIVGGHQRAKLFDKDADVTIEKKFAKPTKTGTVAEGFVIVNGDRFNYREVDWPETREKAANIAANKGAGEWDLPKLSEWLQDLEMEGFDISLTMFDQLETKDLFGSGNTRDPKNVEFQAGDFDSFDHSCPKCGFEFNESK